MKSPSRIAVLRGMTSCVGHLYHPASVRDVATKRLRVVGRVLFGIVFAINSAVHSHLILAYSDFEKVSMNVGFYYMANAGGRLAGTVLSGLVYQTQGLDGCLWWSAGFVLAAYLLSLRLPEVSSGPAKAASAGV